MGLALDDLANIILDYTPNSWSVGNIDAIVYLGYLEMGKKNFSLQPFILSILSRSCLAIYCDNLTKTENTNFMNPIGPNCFKNFPQPPTYLINHEFPSSSLHLHLP